MIEPRSVGFNYDVMLIRMEGRWRAEVRGKVGIVLYHRRPSCIMVVSIAWLPQDKRTEPTIMAFSNEEEEKDETVSPHFHQQQPRTSSKNKRRRCSPSTSSSSSPESSAYFRQSASSAFGAANTLGSLLVCLSAANRSGSSTKLKEEEESCCAVVEAEQHEIEEAAKRHFHSCPIFQERWDHHQQNLHLSADESWEALLDERLQWAVRHLCPCKCYMRAYAPYRDWWALRQRLGSAGTEERAGDAVVSVDSLLRGWSCILLPQPSAAAAAAAAESADKSVVTPTSAYLPRTAFVNPEGRQFGTATEVLRYLRTQQQQQQQARDVVHTMAAQGTSTLHNLFRIVTPLAKTEPNQVDFPPLLSAFPMKTGSQCTTPSTTSIRTPYGLLEELFCDDPWRLLLSTIFLNRTSRVQVDAVLHAFLREWPTAQSVVDEVDDCYSTTMMTTTTTSASSGREDSKMSRLIQSMGMRHRRAAGIVRFSREYLALLQSRTGRTAAFEFTHSDILGLYYCGKYACAAYQIFIQRRWDEVDPPDHALKVYVEFQRGRGRPNGDEGSRRRQGAQRAQHNNNIKKSV